MATKSKEINEIYKALPVNKTLSWVKNKTRFAFDSLIKKFPNALNVIASFPKKAKEIFALDEEQLKKMQEMGLELIKGDSNSFESVFREKGKFQEQTRLKKMNLPSSNPAEFTQVLTMALIAKQIENLSIAVENVAENVNAKKLKTPINFSSLAIEKEVSFGNLRKKLVVFLQA